VLGELTRKKETNRGLDLSRRNRVAFVVPRETTRLARNSFEDIVDEGVHDAHRLGGDSRVGVNLSEDFVNVGRIGGEVLLMSAFDGGAILVDSGGL